MIILIYLGFCRASSKNIFVSKGWSSQTERETGLEMEIGTDAEREMKIDTELEIDVDIDVEIAGRPRTPRPGTRSCEGLLGGLAGRLCSRALVNCYHYHHHHYQYYY